ncbi:MAG TPA: peptide MFS transporter [Rugosimonospora sp.]|nr:peptide MFS transporter [Rugosimonospora sp.]
MASVVAVPADRRRSFASLFLLDMWERFSFYGMLAILYLFAVAAPDGGGLGMGTATAGALVGAYIAGVFLCSMPGAWVGDRLLGTYRATLCGGVLIAAGHATMALPGQAAFPFGLLLVASGTGLLKPNLTVLLGACYPRDAHATRESAFSLFYMSIQVSAIAAPLVTGFLGEYVNWHAGFGAAAVGMAAGVACFRWGRRYLGEVGRSPVAPGDRAGSARVVRRGVLALSLLSLLLLADRLGGTLRAQHVVAAVGLIGLVAPVLAFRAIARDPRVRPAERVRVRAFVRVFLASAWFWLLVSQSLSLLSGFAKDGTDRWVLGFHAPAAWFQSLHPLFILLGAPVAAWLWPRLRDRAGVAVKLAGGLALAGLAFLVMAVAAHLAQHGPVSPLWLVATYALLSAGELALAPVGLSVTVAVAPEAFASQMMGLWWLSAALGAGAGSQLVRLTVVLPTDGYYLIFGLLSFIIAGALAASRARLAGLLSVSPDPFRAAPLDAPVPG